MEEFNVYVVRENGDKVLYETKSSLVEATQVASSITIENGKVSIEKVTETGTEVLV